MSLTPYSPTNPNRGPDFKRPLFALALVVLVAGGIFLLAQALGVKPGEQIAAFPTPTTAALATPPRGQCLGGPQLPTTTATPLPTQASAQATQPPAPGVTATPLSPAMRSLQTLSNAIVPARDPYALASRLPLGGKTDLPRTTERPAGDYQVGHRDVFNISDIQNRNYYTITATIRKVTDHAYWYVANRETVDAAALERLASAFEDKIYPTNRAVFGSEWT